VEAVELTAPGACNTDRKNLYGQLRSRKIFGAFNDQEGEAIWERLLSISVDRLIPSFYSYFEDINYLQGPVKCIKSLIDLSPRDSVSTALLRAFRDGNQRDGQYVVQKSESKFVLRQGDSLEGEDSTLRQLWIMAMRYSGGKLDWRPDKATLCEIATHAYQLGFKSTPIMDFVRESTDRHIAHKALVEARRPEHFKYDASAFENHIQQMIGFFSTAKLLTEKETKEVLEVESHDRPPRRCGIPEPKDHKHDRLSLFLDKLHRTNEQEFLEIGSFFIRRSVYFAFFGRSLATTNRSTTPEQTRAPESDTHEVRTDEEVQLVFEQHRTKLAEQENESQRLAERDLSRLMKKRSVEEDRLAQLAEQRQAEENKLAQLTIQWEAKEFRLAQVAVQRQSEESRLAQLVKQREAEEILIAQLVGKRQTEEALLAQLVQERHIEMQKKMIEQEREQHVGEGGRIQMEQDLFEDDIEIDLGEDIEPGNGEQTQAVEEKAQRHAKEL
jgi:hypothetical protein